MDSKYPIPAPNETWNVLEKYNYHDDTDDYDKYVILANITKDKKTIQRKITKMYKNILVPTELKQKLKGLTPDKIESKVYNYKENIRIQNAIAARRKWTKFGMTKGEAYDATTKVSDQDIFFELKHPELIENYPNYHHIYNDTKSQNTTEKSVNNITCRHCKGSHWSHGCPNRDRFDIELDNIKYKSIEKTNEIKPIIDVNDVQQPLKTGSSYLPPHRRNKFNDTDERDSNNGRGRGSGRGRGRGSGGGRGYNSGRGGGRSYNNRDGRGDFKKHDKEEVKGIKINNIAPYSDDEEVKEICLQYGRIYKFKLIKREAYAFCFVTYTRQDVADVAAEELKKIHLDSCVWNTEWAKY
jgi:uncharacterized membrane protein YgcG